MHTPGHTPEHLIVPRHRHRERRPSRWARSPATSSSWATSAVPTCSSARRGQAGTMEAGARQLFRSLRRFARAARLSAALARPRRRLGVRQGARRGAAVDARLRAPVQLGVRRSTTKTRSCGPCSRASPSRRAYFAEMKRINRDGPRVLGAPHPPAAGRRRRRGHGARGRRDRGGHPSRARVRRPRVCRAPSTSRPAAHSPRGPDGCCPTTATSYLSPTTGPATPRTTCCAGSPASGSTAWRAWPGPRWSTAGARGRGRCRRSRASITSSSTRRRRRRRCRARRAHGSRMGGRTPAGRGEHPARRACSPGWSSCPADRPLVVHCQAGGRAAIAASVLSARGVTDLRLYGGGYAEWSAAGHPIASGAASEGRERPAGALGSWSAGRAVRGRVLLIAGRKLARADPRLHRLGRRPRRLGTGGIRRRLRPGDRGVRARLAADARRRRHLRPRQGHGARAGGRHARRLRRVSGLPLSRPRIRRAPSGRQRALRRHRPRHRDARGGRSSCCSASPRSFRSTCSTTPSA